MRTDPVYAVLGRSGLPVSSLCFGTIPRGRPRGMVPTAAVSLLRQALEMGINFLDTAELYENYDVIRSALSGIDKPIVVATKSYAPDAGAMRISLEKARRELDRDRIDIFLLHEMESPATLRGHRAALEELLEARTRGIVGAVGCSTHTVAGLRAASTMPEFDVVHPLINHAGWGIRDGTAADMAEAIETAASLGLGVYAMKVLAGGHLGSQAAGAIAYVRELPGVVSMAIGLQSGEELLADWAYCRGESPAPAVLAAVSAQPRRLFVEPWCDGCGVCLTACPFGALRLEDGRVSVRPDACLLCGYCARGCKKICLKVV